MQVGGKSDETGWGVYEESRRGGAIIATAHEHSYSRTHLMSSMEQQIVASTENTLVLEDDDPATPGDEGRSFAFVAGLGGRGIRNQELSGSWWASIYTSTQGARHGALFGVFNLGGDPRLAYFYLKNVDGVVVDEFFVRSTLGSGADADLDGVEDTFDNCTAAFNPEQVDVDHDGCGDACTEAITCDGDGDTSVAASDYALLMAQWEKTAPATNSMDCNGDTVVSSADYATLLDEWDHAVGPSGLTSPLCNPATCQCAREP